VTIKTNDNEFSDIFDSFIDLANTHSSNVDYKKVSYALLYAAAHFNAFSIWANADNVAEFKSEKNSSKDRFINEYKKSLTHSISDFEKNFDRYRIENKIE
jgi:Protein of unknown function (DUF3144)